MWVVVHIHHGGKYRVGLKDGKEPRAGGPLGRFEGLRVEFPPERRKASTATIFERCANTLAPLSWIEVEGQQWEVDLVELARAMPTVASEVGPYRTISGHATVDCEEVEEQAGRRFYPYVVLDIRHGELSPALAIPDEIATSVEKFRADYPDRSKVGFLMMKFSTERPYADIADAVRQTLAAHDLHCLRADDREYHPDLYWNVMTYIYGSSFGIAVFDRVDAEVVNPNIAFEVGYLMALGLPVCLLKDKSIARLHTDLMGKLYRAFDPHDAGPTIRDAVGRWLSDLRLGS
jgi:hypothetical protein